MKPIAIIGAGNSGFALAAHLLSEGALVHMWNRPRDDVFDAVARAGGIGVEGLINGRFLPQLMTHDLSEALNGADVVLVTVPANAHAEVARLMAPHLRPHQVVVLSPGRTCGALEVTRVLADLGAAPVRVAEMQTIIHTCRKDTASSVIILTCKNRVLLSAFNPADTAGVLEAVPACLRGYLAPASNPLQTSLGNVGMILHCAPVLFNVGWIESPRTRFKYYYEGITPTIAAYLERLDAERIAIAAACEIDTLSVAEWLRQSYGSAGACLYECIQNTTSYAKIDAPRTLRHRYIFEDVPTGLVPLEAIGRALDVPTPLATAVIDLAAGMLRFDFRKCGRDCDALGLAPDLSCEAVVSRLSGGPSWRPGRQSALQTPVPG